MHENSRKEQYRSQSGGEQYRVDFAYKKALLVKAETAYRLITEGFVGTLKNWWDHLPC